MNRPTSIGIGTIWYYQSHHLIVSAGWFSVCDSHVARPQSQAGKIRRFNCGNVKRLPSGCIICDLYGPGSIRSMNEARWIMILYNDLSMMSVASTQNVCLPGGFSKRNFEAKGILSPPGWNRYLAITKQSHLWGIRPMMESEIPHKASQTRHSTLNWRSFKKNWNCWWDSINLMIRSWQRRGLLIVATCKDLVRLIWAA